MGGREDVVLCDADLDRLYFDARAAHTKGTGGLRVAHWNPCPVPPCSNAPSPFFELFDAVAACVALSVVVSPDQYAHNQAVIELM
jgi:hypothetical protein